MYYQSGETHKAQLIKTIETMKTKKSTGTNPITYKQLHDLAWKLHKLGGDKQFKKDVQQIKGYAETSSVLTTLINLKSFCEKHINVIANQSIKY